MGLIVEGQVVMDFPAENEPPLDARLALAGDFHRPLFHYLPPANWMNDPSGLIQWEGRTHLFYQANPHGPFHGTIHWGHAVSDDLVHWEDWPLALIPTPGGPDGEGCWSGCAVNHDGIPTIAYTAVFPQTVCLATSRDGLRTWQPHPQNPVIPAPPAPLDRRSGGHFRDPFIWRKNGVWYLLLGCKSEGVGGLILLYRSTDLVDWEYLHPLLEGDVHSRDPNWTGTMWECPNFVDFGSQQVLIFSVQAGHDELLHPLYTTGRMENLGFIPDQAGILVHGRCFYAPQVLRTGDGRILMWGWLQEGRSPEACMEAGWAGVMSTPIVLSLRADGRPGLAPAVELQQLRRKHWQAGDLVLSPEAAPLLMGIRGDRLEIQAVLDFGADPAALLAGLRLRCSPDGREETRVFYDGARQLLVIDRVRSSLDSTVDKRTAAAPLELNPGERLSLHLLLDGSVLEVFANGHTCLACRLYPTLSESDRLGLIAAGGPVRLIALDIWEMASIWPRPT